MGNGLTDEMRKWGHDMAFVNDNPRFAKRVDELCDNIDKEHEKAMSEQLESLTDDMEPMAEGDMAKNGWVQLPVDADGEVVHIGDEVEELNTRVVGRARGEVVRVVFSKHGTSVRIDTGLSYVDLNPWNVHHSCHKPTVEDILQEFGDEAAMDCSSKETIIEFANRIREAVRDEQ